MSAEEPLPARVEVRPAAAEEAPVLANLMELYVHDLSEIVELQLKPDGRFGYPRLALYWREEGRFPFLVRVDGHLAGFALVSQGSEISGDPRVWDMAEFFVARGWRKRGIGAAAARELWRRFPGPWEVRVLEGNHAARAFWASAVDAFTQGRAETYIHASAERRWQVFSFLSGDNDAPRPSN
jgi:predicted acetyltransferase